MTLTVYKELEQRSNEWYAARRGIVTASVVGKLITSAPVPPTAVRCFTCDAIPDAPCVSVAKGKTGPLKNVHPARATTARLVPPVLTVGDVDDLAWLLASERITGWTEDTFISDAMWRGIIDEPRAIAAYSERYETVTTTGFMVENRWGFRIGYSPDGLVNKFGLVEVKSRAPKTQVKTIVNAEIPAANMAQLQCGLLVSGRDWIDYISYAGGMHLWVQRVLPDPDWFKVIVAAARAVEQRITEIVNTYNANAEGLALTERVTELEIVI